MAQGSFDLDQLYFIIQSLEGYALNFLNYTEVFNLI